MSSFVSPFRNFSENHIRKQLSYCFFNSLQFSPILFIEIPENVNNSWWITNYIQHNKRFQYKYCTLRNVIICSLILTKRIPVRTLDHKVVLENKQWERYYFPTKNYEFNTKSWKSQLPNPWVLYRIYLNPTITKEFYRYAQSLVTKTATTLNLEYSNSKA